MSKADKLFQNAHSFSDRLRIYIIKALEDLLTAVGGGVTPVTGVTPTLTRVTGAGAGSVTAGKRTVSFFNAGDANATVAGSTLEPGESITFPELSYRDVYGAITYDALTSTLVITTVE